MPGRLGRFAPRAVPTALAVGAVALFAALGNWQLGRAAEKRGLAADFAAGGPPIDWQQLPPDAPRYQRVRLRGHYDPAHQFLLDNMSHESVAGVHVLTPLLLDDGSAVLVNRGWAPYGPTRQDLPAVEVGSEKRTIVGRLDELPRPGIWLKAPPAAGWPRVVQYPKMPELAAALGRELAPRQVLLDPGVPDGYVREWTVTGTTVDRHIGYAVQWFAFAAVAAALWVVLSFRKTGEPT
ncbi:MAG TPA: SURF1 family protein [Steroidobacteraceae bacterium]|nr:SURF1 family protein [Steroidobacteraceae bacterium]